MAKKVPQGPNGHPMTDDRFLVAMGCFEGVEGSDHFGANPSVGTSFEIIREAGGDHTWLSAADTHEVTSSSTDDDGSPAGTGAQIVTVEGLDANYAQVSEDVTLNGTTVVTMSTAMLRVNKAYVKQCGSGEVNAGDIYVTESGGTHSSGVPDDLDLVEEKIPAGYSQSESTIFTVPAGHTFYVMDLAWFSAGGQDVTIRVYDRNPLPPTGSPIRRVLFESVADNTDFEFQPASPIVIPEKHSVWIEAATQSSTTEVAATIDGFLVNNLQYGLDVTAVEAG